MGLMDWFRMGRVAVHAAKAVKQQRTLGRDLAALPMAAFVEACLANFNNVGGAWRARARTADPGADAIATRLGLPAELREFYLHCDGFEAEAG